MPNLRDNALLHAFIAIVLAFVLGGLLIWGISENVRWTIYLILCPFLFVFLFRMRNTWVGLAALFIPLIFIEQMFITMRSLGPLIVGISLPIFATIYLSFRMQAQKPVRLGAYGVLWAILLLVAVTSMFHNPEDLLVELHAVQLHYLEGFFYFVLALLAFKEVRDLRRFAWLLLGIAVVCAFLQFVFLNTGEAILQQKYAGEDVTRAWRFGGPLGNSNSLADLYAMNIPVAILLAVAERKWWKRSVLIAGGALVITALILTGSRGGMFSGITGLSITLLLLGTQGKRRIVTLPIALIILVVGYRIADSYFGEFYTLTVERLDRGFEDVRLEIWEITLQIIADNPLGIGHDPQTFVQEMHSRRPGYFFSTPHNLYLELATTMGVSGLLAFVALVGTALWQGIKLLAKDMPAQRTQILMIPLMMVIVFLVGSFTEPLFFNGHKLNHLFWFLIGSIVWSYSHEYTNTSHPTTTLDPDPDPTSSSEKEEKAIKEKNLPPTRFLS